MLVQPAIPRAGIELLRKASSLAPDDAEIRLHLAKALLKTGRQGRGQERTRDVRGAGATRRRRAPRRSRC